MRSFRALAQGACVSLLLALSMSFAVRVPAAIAQTTPNLWSIQLDGGLFVLNEANRADPTFGMRYSKHYSPYVQGGMLTGVTYKSARLVAPATGPEKSAAHVELARIDGRLIPLMGFVQVNLTEKAWLVPFAGFGAGYEWLTRRTLDHRTGQDSTATYGNIAWEGYAGLGLRLTSKVRLNGELFYNGGSLERRVLESSEGAFTEAVHVNGVGARVGLDMVFE